MTLIVARTRRALAIVLSVIWPASCANAQDLSITPVRPQAPIFWRPYLAPEVPPIRLANGPRIRELIRAGRLYLTAQDAIALALENNVDIEVDRYNPISLAWRVERAEAGGTLPGVPSVSSQASSVTNGQGVLGSQAAVGVTVSGSNGTNRNTGNATITQIGPVTQTLDPSIQEATTFSHRSLPQPNLRQTLSPNLILDQRVYTGSYQQGFLSGGSVNISYNNRYLNENSPTDVINPSLAPTLSVQFQHNLLQGFGVAVNARTITVAKINLNTSDLNFKSQVTGVVVNVLNAYYGLVADYEDVQAKRSANETARTFYEDSKQQVQIGSMAEIDLITAQSQVASTGQDLVNSQVALEQQELTLKNLISRTGTADPLVSNVEIVPLDRIEIPPNDNLAPVKELVARALANRSDIAAEKVNLQTTEINNLGTRNAVLPTLEGFASTSNAGAAGTPHVIVTPFGTEFPDKYFVGGLGTALGQVFRRNFPSEQVGVFLQAALRNRQAQADSNIDQLQLRQSQLSNQKDLKQAQVDVLNSVVALTQARAKYDAAVRSRILNQQLLEAEQNKYKLGASTPYNIVQQQRDLIVSQNSELATRVSYSNARVNLEQTVGTILDTYHISLAETQEGRLKRASSLPAQLPEAVDRVRLTK